MYLTKNLTIITYALIIPIIIITSIISHTMLVLWFIIIALIAVILTFFGE